MDSYLYRYDVRRLVEKCQKMDLIELIEYLKDEIKLLLRIKDKSDDIQRYKSLAVELETFITGEPRLVADYNKEYIKAVIQHFVLENKMSEDLLKYLE